MLRAMKPQLSSISTVNDQTERLLGFSDAVFAIAMTFLALDLGAIPLDVGQPDGPTASEYIHENMTNYAVYFGTFLVVGFLWWRHHLMFRYIKRSSTGLVWTNTLMLAFVAMLPYPASVVSEAPGFGLALLILLVPLTLIGLLMWLEWEIAVKQRLVIPGLPRNYVTYIRSQVVASPIVLLIASVLAFVSWQTDSSTVLRLAAGMWALLAILPVVLRRRWPAPQQAYSVPIDTLSGDWRSLEDTAEEEATRIRTLLEKLRNGSDTDRITILTDGILAIAVTILALQLRPPPEDEVITNEVLLENLADVPGTTYLATFVLISLFWRGHVRIFAFLRGADPVVLWLNLFFLMFISFLPTAAALQARDENSTTVSFYLLMMLFTAASLGLLGQYGARAKGLAITVGGGLDRKIATLRSITAIAAFAIAVTAVWVFDMPVLSNLVWVIFVIGGQYSRQLRRKERLPEQAVAT